MEIQSTQKLEPVPALDCAIELADRIQDLSMPLDHQRERLQELVCLAPQADAASAQELGQHYLILNALFERFSLEAVRAVSRSATKGHDPATSYLIAATRAHRACLACLSALKVLREAPTPPRLSGAK